MSGSTRSHGSPIRIDLSSLSDHHKQQLKELLEFAAGQLREAPTWKVVQVGGYGSVRAYSRKAPGAEKFLETFGGEANFLLCVGFISVGATAYEDWRRSELTASQRLGRASIELLAASGTALAASGGVAFPALGLLYAYAGVKVFFPEMVDKLTIKLFSTDSYTDEFFTWLTNNVSKPINQHSIIHKSNITRHPLHLT